MFKIGGLLLLIPVLVIVALFVIIGNIIKAFKPNGRSSSHSRTRQSPYKNAGNNSTTNPQKEFSKDEGEYVDYEEIKEGDSK